MTTISTTVVFFLISIERRNRMHVFTIYVHVVKIWMTFNLFLSIHFIDTVLNVKSILVVNKKSICLSNYF